jgi:type VI secretion system protein ImpG
MSDELLPYFDRELKHLQALGAEFAQRHPQVASRLKLGPEGTGDPHVERLVQAVAFLNARIRHKLEDDFSRADAVASERPVSSLSAASAIAGHRAARAGRQPA